MAGAVGVEVCAMVYLLGGITGYVVILSDIFAPFLMPVLREEDDSNSLGELIDPYSVASVRNFVGLVMVIFVVYPLCLLRYIDALKFASIGALICVFYIVLLIVSHSIEPILDDNPSIGHVESVHLKMSFFRAFPIITFAFSFHTAFFAIYKEMENRSEIDMVVCASTLIACSGYLLVGIFGYLAFKDSVENNILLNFEHDVWIQIGKLSLSVVICFSYPLLHFPLRESEIALLYLAYSGLKHLDRKYDLPSFVSSFLHPDGDSSERDSGLKINRDFDGPASDPEADDRLKDVSLPPGLSLPQEEEEEDGRYVKGIGDEESGVPPAVPPTSSPPSSSPPSSPSSSSSSSSSSCSPSRPSSPNKLSQEEEASPSPSPSSPPHSPPRPPSPPRISIDLPRVPPPLPPVSSTPTPTSATISRNMHIGLTTTNVLASYILAVLIPDISSVFGLVGATAGCVIVFIFPCAAFIALERHTAPPKMVYFAYVVTVIAIAFAIIGTLVTLADIVSPDEEPGDDNSTSRDLLWSLVGLEA